EVGDRESRQRHESGNAAKLTFKGRRRGRRRECRARERGRHEGREGRYAAEIGGNLDEPAGQREEGEDGERDRDGPTDAAGWLRPHLAEKDDEDGAEDV